MKYFVLTCDAVGLAAMCIFGLTASVAFSLWRLSMAGFLRCALTISDLGLSRFSRSRFPSLKILTKGRKTWITVSWGNLTLGGAIEKQVDGSWEMEHLRKTPESDQ